MNYTRLRHLGFLVDDVRKTADFYTAAFGVGPFKVYTVPFTEVMVRGKGPYSFTTRIALARLGESELELVESRPSTGRSPYFEEVKQDRGGCMHHGAFTVEDLDEAVARFERAGIGVLTTGRFPGGRFAYLDCEASAGIIYELMEISPRPSK